MNTKIIELNDLQVEDIENRLEQYDRQHMSDDISGNIKIGVVEDGRLIAGADASMTAFRILYVSTVFVDEN